MIDFENVELTDRPSLFVMPQTESGYLLHRMRVAGIEYEAYGHRDICEGRAPLDLDVAARALMHFEDVGLGQAPPCIISSRVRREDLLPMARSLYAEPFDPAFLERQHAVAMADGRNHLTGTPGLWNSFEAFGGDVGDSLREDFRQHKDAETDFEDEETLKFCLEEAMALYRPSIRTWRERAQYGDVVGFSVLLDPEMYSRTGMNTRHRGIMDDLANETLKAYLTDAVYVMLEYNPMAEAEIRVRDFHPDFFVPETIEDEQTDLRVELPESDLYRQASPTFKTFLEWKVDPANDCPVRYGRGQGWPYDDLMVEVECEEYAQLYRVHISSRETTLETRDLEGKTVPGEFTTMRDAQMRRQGYSPLEGDARPVCLYSMEKGQTALHDEFAKRYPEVSALCDRLRERIHELMREDACGPATIQAAAPEEEPRSAA